MARNGFSKPTMPCLSGGSSPPHSMPSGSGIPATTATAGPWTFTPCGFTLSSDTRWELLRCEDAPLLAVGEELAETAPGDQGVEGLLGVLHGQALLQLGEQFVLLQLALMQVDKLMDQPEQAQLQEL